MGPQRDTESQDTEPLSLDEIAAVRRILEQSKHEARLRGRIRVVLPWFITLLAGIIAAIDWINRHLKWSS